MRRLEVLSKSCPSSILLSYFSGPVTDICWLSRRDKVLVLVMKFDHPYYLKLLTCSLVFDQIALSTSNSLVIVLVKHISEWI